MKHFKTCFLCCCGFFFLFLCSLRSKNPEHRRSVVPVLRFFLLLSFLRPLSAMGSEGGRKWREKCGGKNPQFLLWRNLADLRFASGTQCFCSSCGLRSCISLLFIFILLGYSSCFSCSKHRCDFSPFFPVYSPVCSMGSAWLWVGFFFKSYHSKEVDYLEKIQSPQAVSLQITGM